VVSRTPTFFNVEFNSTAKGNFQVLGTYGATFPSGKGLDRAAEDMGICFTMKLHRLFLILLPCAILLACDVADLLKTPEESSSKFKMFDPATALSDAQLEVLGLKGLQGSQEDIANQIYQWQKQRMYNVGFGTSLEALEAAYTLRWNTILPGIYPVSEIVVERKKTIDGEEKIYGTCWDFAAVFIAVARAYNLEVRMTAIKETPNVPTGMPLSEYNALKPKLEKAKVSFTYTQISNAIKIPYKHYRAEVKIGGEWVPKDASVAEGTSPPGTYEEYRWDERADPNLTTK